VLGLIHNGVEATQGAGAVSVTAELCDDPPDGVSISIRDEGIGIPEEEIGKVFDLFHSTKPHGIGLGMAIVHKIITSHGGSIDIESVWGKGTTVTIGLPRGD
jgi:signal transduction histidine kinase